MSRAAKAPGKASQLRIIGGQWRGRKLSFYPAPGLRPTTDRVRETLFNWLAPHIHGAHCADLFAGSGALGLEALSRGAACCDFCDCSGESLAQLQRHLDTLEASDRGHCHRGTAAQFLAAAGAQYDIVFIDPPFDSALVESTCSLLQQRQLLAKEALVYVETAVQEENPGVPPNWELHREKRAGGVCYRLFVVG